MYTHFLKKWIHLVQTIFFLAYTVSGLIHLIATWGFLFGHAQSWVNIKYRGDSVLRDPMPLP